MKTTTDPDSSQLHATIKPGIDAHAKWFYGARQLDGATPQPVRKMTLQRLPRFAREAFPCHEAGAFGYHPRRKFNFMGVTNDDVQPQDWDERGKGVKNDRLDAMALCQRLDRFTRGNRKAFSLVHVPCEDEERHHSFTRQRQQIEGERQRYQAIGRSLLASHGIHVTGKGGPGRPGSASAKKLRHGSSNRWRCSPD